MAKLKVDTDSYLTELIKECTELDMNEDPEVDHIQDSDERKKKASSWLDSRLIELKHNEFFANFELRNAMDNGYLDLSNFNDATKKYHEAYEELREQARQRYQEAVRGLEDVSASP